MEFINAETITPSPQEEQIWGKVEDKLEQSYASTPGQACTARRAIDATKDFNINVRIGCRWQRRLLLWPN